MSTPFEVTFDLKPLACDGSNYNSWSAYVLDIFRVMGPQMDLVVVVSISCQNVDRSKLTQEEEKCIQLNAQASYILIRALSEDVLDAIMDEDDNYHTSHDAHRIWITLKDMCGACENYGQNASESEEKIQRTQPRDHKNSFALDDGLKPEVPVLETGCSGSDRVAINCSISENNSCHQPHEESTAPSHSSSPQYTHKYFMAKGEKKRKDEDEEFEFEFDKMSKRNKKRVVKLMETMCKQRGELERQENHLSERIKELESLNKEMKKLNESNVSLLDKCTKLEKGYACATNSLSCVASLEEANQKLKVQIEELTSKYVNLQATHKELECSHERLVDSHTMLEMTHEVMIATVKLLEPQSHKFLVESCDDLIAQENDYLKQEVKKLKMDLFGLKGKSIAQPSQDNHDVMVKKLERGSTLQSSCNNGDKSTINKCFECSKMGHFASMCPKKKEDKPALSKRQRSLSKKRCFNYHEKGHKIASCTSSGSHSWKTGGSGLANKRFRFGKTGGTSFGCVAVRSQDKKATGNIKHKIYYACQKKGHLGKNCSNGNIPKPKSIHNDSKELRKNLNDSCAAKVTHSPKVSTKAIWVPKTLLTNLSRPNMVWVPKYA
ncbi:hypothetical protein SETIT_4G095700v2 [Setaria italica]|uniref:CCHC-type domain-containing protein n=1 Tax=Setaria italica TaxID=4555 RepID=A0A368QT10_SETIT|nr:hypothetical protein SETIT_4G095700v2 [Setaria italica]